MQTSSNAGAEATRYHPENERRGMPTERKDIMAPDNEPTDEELAIVMREARDEAMRKRAEAESALRERIRTQVAAALRARQENAPSRTRP